MIKVLFIFLILILIFSIYLLATPHKLNPRDKQKIIKFGVIHFTTTTSVSEIISDRVIKSDKYKKSYFFIDNESYNDDVLLYNHLQKRECAIIISNLNRSQINNLKIRRLDFALEYDGDFHIDYKNKIRITYDVKIKRCGFSKFKFKFIILKVTIIAILFCLLLLVFLP